MWLATKISQRTWRETSSPGLPSCRWEGHCRKCVVLYITDWQKLGRWMDGQMDGPTGGRTDDLLEKASLSMAFHNWIEDLNASAQLSSPYPPHHSRPTPPLQSNKQQGRIHSRTVADGWAGAVMRKLRAIKNCHGGRRDRPTDGLKRYITDK